MALSPSDLVTAMLGTAALVIAMSFYLHWRRERRRELDFREREFHEQRILKDREWEREEQRRREDRERAEEEREREEYRRYDERERQAEREVGERAGTGSGGYIVMDLPEEQRPFFHDLLKGFEEYARLKGYGLTFSIDATVTGKIAFKFTLTDAALDVGAERVRRDFHEYVEKVRDGAESIDKLPVITLT